MDERIKAFLDYATHADNFEGDEFSRMREIAYDEAKKLAGKKSYKEAFRKKKVNGRSILNTAILERLKLLPRLLLDVLDVDPSSNMNDPVGRMSLHYVCEAGDLILLEEFIVRKYHKIEYNARDKAGLIPLHLAILYGQTNIASEMLKWVAVVENHDLFFGRSIHLAAYMNQISVVKSIIEKFPGEVSIVTSGFCTPPVCALFGNSTECFEYLWNASPLMADRIVSKAVAYAKSEDTALHTVIFLIGNKADPNGFDEELCEEPAVIVAAKKRWTDVLRVLVQRTRAIDGVQWTVNGVLAYIETPAFKEMDEQRALNKVETLTARMIQELNNMNVLAAMIICESLKSNLNEIAYNRHHSLCKFFWELAKSSSLTRMEANAEKLRSHAWSFYRHSSSNELAMLAIDGCLALDPDDAACLHLRESLIKKIAEGRTSG